MKLEALAALFSLLTAANAHEGAFGRHAALAHKRQATTSATAAASSSSASGLSAATTAATPASSAAPSVTTLPTTGSDSAQTANNGIPALSEITSGMPTGTIWTASTTYTAGASPTALKGAPALPSAFVFSPTDWPPMDKIPPTDSPQVQEWMKELDGHDIPDIRPTLDNTCGGDPEAAAQAEERGWWTCGGWTDANDITVCPDKLTWGISFDDGPGPYTGKLLQYLDEKDLAATFFVVGSRCIERPQLLVEEHMAGHEISVHTWSHHALTTMTNEQIVAELGWTRHAIQTILGVTPVTFRAPFGDIDNRVRAIANAMNLRSIIWTRYNGFAYDTNDWKVAGGVVSPTDQMATFDSILGNATLMDNGFIVLEHDLYEQTVDLAIGYTLPAAQSHSPAFTLKSIGECQNIPLTDMYLETTTNKTVAAKSSNSTTSSSTTTPKGAASTGSDSSASSFAIPALSAVFAAVLGSSLLL